MADPRVVATHCATSARSSCACMSSGWASAGPSRASASSKTFELMRPRNASITSNQVWSTPGHSRIWPGVRSNRSLMVEMPDRLRRDRSAVRSSPVRANASISGAANSVPEMWFSGGNSARSCSAACLLPPSCPAIRFTRWRRTTSLSGRPSSPVCVSPAPVGSAREASTRPRNWSTSRSLFDPTDVQAPRSPTVRPSRSLRVPFALLRSLAKASASSCARTQ